MKSNPCPTNHVPDPVNDMYYVLRTPYAYKNIDETAHHDASRINASEPPRLATLHFKFASLGQP